MRSLPQQSERSTLLVENFPRSLRRAIKAKAAAEGRLMTEVFIELLEKALAQEAGKKERKP